MKKILIGLMGLMGLIGFIGCDKIDSSEYTIYNGATFTWIPVSESITPVQRAFVEKYTGPKCNNCPQADTTLDEAHEQYGDRLVAVSINHPTGMGTPFNGDPDMRTEGGTAWDNYLKISSIPAAYLNRSGEKFLGKMGEIKAAIGTALQETPVVALNVGFSNDTINVDFTLLQDYSAPLTLTVVVTEDSLVYKQLMPDGSVNDNYPHNHMLRKFITGIWGDEIPNSGQAGESLRGTINHTFDGSDMVLANCHIVAFVSDKNTHRILNCACCKINTNN